MDVSIVMAELLVTDTHRSVEFCTRLFGRAPDTNPMDGLHEWHFGDASAVQVFEEPARAGHSGVTLHVGDLDAEVQRLDGAHVEHEAPVEATYVRVVELADPDGNRIVLTGAK